MADSEDDASFESVGEESDKTRELECAGDFAEEFTVLKVSDVPVDPVDPSNGGASNETKDTETFTVIKAAEHVEDSEGDVSSKEAAEVATKDPKSVLEKLAEEDSSAKVWGWSNISSWGSSVLNTATSSVSSFTTQVGEGLFQVLETVESGLIEPEEPEEPEFGADNDSNEPVITQEISRVTDDPTNDEPVKNDEDQKAEEDVEKQDGGNAWFSGWGLSSLTGVVNKTSSVVQQTTSASMKVVSSGLDVLESIGKRTYDVLTEGDHGLKKVIELNRQNKPNLSQTLREAKELADSRDKEEAEFAELRKSHYGAWFDDFQGLVQLEALEMLSGTSEGKVHQLLEVLSRDASESLKVELTRIKQTFESMSDETDDDDSSEHDFNQLLMDYVAQLSLNISIQKLLNSHEKSMKWLALAEEHEEPRKTKDVHQRAMESLAEFTACSIEHFHRVGQLLLQDKDSQVMSFPETSVTLTSVTKVLCREMSLQSARFVQCISSASTAEGDQNVTELITSIYLEAGNSSSYINDSFRLLLPIIQLATIKAHPLCQELDLN